jgi:hypothetical protein
VTTDVVVRRAAARLGLALLFAVVLALVVWFATPAGLHPPIDIVGYPTFENFDFHRQFLLYRLAMWVLPLVTLAVWWLLGRAGPFAVDRRAATVVPLTDAEPIAAADVDAPPDAPDEPLSWWRYGRLFPTAAVVALVVSGGSGSNPTQEVSAVGVVAGLAAVGALLGAAWLLALGTRSHTSRDPQRHWDTALALMHTYAGATVAVLALVWYERHAAVLLVENDDLVRYPWVPWWGAGLACLLIIGGLVLGARNFSPAAVERAMVRVVTGSVLVYLLTSQMAGQIGLIQGFDDMQSVTGADLLSRGFFPWSDFLFIHGLFEDALRSSAGFALFGHTMWATHAAVFMIWIPLTWVGVYWVAVWATRGRAAPLVALALLLIWASVHISPSYRWVGMSVVWLLLGEAVRRNRWPWTGLMTAVLFVEAVLVPEASLQVIAVTIVLVASDLVHRGDGVGRWRALGRTKAFVLAGLVCTVLWCAYLATQGALSAFLRYYVIFGPGHAESGALPIPDYADWLGITYFVVCLVVASMTIWAMGFALLQRRPLGSRHWVAFGAALTTGLYAEKGLARFDDGHLLQVVTVTLPLLVVWVALLLTALDDKVRRLVHGRATPATRRRVDELARSRVSLSAARQPASAVVAALLLVTLPSVHDTVRTAPGRNVVDVSGGRVPLLGWTADDAVDRPMLRDLRTVVDTYTQHGPVFDFTNSPGYFYYLLGEDPPTSYYHVSMAIPEFTQEIVISELEKSRPALVVFHAPFGLPAWDGPHNEVRHFTLSQYLLDGWTPLLGTHDVLFLIRNDLVGSVPDPPTLKNGPELTRLWFAGPVCDFGYTANFLASEQTGHRLSLEVPPPVPTRRISFRGWAYDAANNRPVRHVVAVAGGVVVASVESAHTRNDVAEELANPEAAASGFAGGRDTQRKGELSFYAVYSDGVAHPLPGTEPRESLTRPGQSPIPVSPEPATGHVDEVDDEDVEVSTIHVPHGTELPSYQLAELSSSRGNLGTGQVEITDSPSVLANREQRIVAGTLPVTGDSIRVRVGSCLQWHGYDREKLYLTQRDLAHPIDRMVLSDVARPYQR